MSCQLLGEDKERRDLKRNQKRENGMMDPLQRKSQSLNSNSRSQMSQMRMRKRLRERQMPKKPLRRVSRQRKRRMLKMPSLMKRLRIRHLLKRKR